jgi:hypothetical protein
MAAAAPASVPPQLPLVVNPPDVKR